MTTSESTPAVVFKDPPKIRRPRKPLGSRIFNETTRDALRQRPGTWAMIHSAAYAVPAKRWKEAHTDFQFYVANVTERDENGEFVGDKKYEVYARFIGENGEYATDEGASDAPEQDEESPESSQDEGSNDNFSPAAGV